MILIPPTTITTAMLHDCSIAEPSAVDTANPSYQGAWAAGTNYSVNAIVLVAATHRLYNSLKNGNVGYVPGGTGNETWWQDWGATERWRAFDGVVGVQATGTDTITYELDPGPVDSVSLHNLEADNVTVTMTDVGGAGAPVVWHEHTLTDGLFVSDIAKTDFPLTYTTPHLVIVIDYTGFTPLVGEIVVGQKETIGDTQYNASVGIIDYSVKEVDTFGNYTVLERAYSKRMTADAVIENTALDEIYNILAENRAKACVWVGTTAGYASMIIYGFYKDFSIEIPYPTNSICSLEIEGLV
jgi:hypothetical protein